MELDAETGKQRGKLTFMLMTDSPPQQENETMHHREITLGDGRYMIFYTFEAEGSSVQADVAGSETDEEKNV